MKNFLAFDLGGSSIKYGVYDEVGKTICHGGEAQGHRMDLKKIMESIDTIVQKYPDISGIGISVPGLINKNTKIISYGGAIEALHDVDLRRMLKDKYNLPVEIENDANCAALAEYWIGAGRGCENIICITIGTGIGGGLVLNGKLYRGSHNFAGEFGLIFTHGDGKENFGYAATGKLLERASAADRGIKNGKDFFSALSNPDIMEIYWDWIDKLAKGVYGLCIALDPDKVLLGGGVSARKEIYGDIMKVIDEIAYYPYEWVVEPCTFGNDAGKIGAVYNLLQTI